MASTLTERLSRAVKTMRGQARITESNVQEMLREVRMALLEADVALPVVRDFITRVKDKALGAEVVGSLSPGQALVGIVNRELAATMGEGVADLGVEQRLTVVLSRPRRGRGEREARALEAHDGDGEAALDELATYELAGGRAADESRLGEHPTQVIERRVAGARRTEGEDQRRGAVELAGQWRAPTRVCVAAAGGDLHEVSRLADRFIGRFDRRDKPP